MRLTITGEGNNMQTQTITPGTQQTPGTQYKTVDINKGTDGHVCRISLDIKDNPIYCHANIGDKFPVHTCLDKNTYGLIVTLWRKKPDFNNIPDGQSHYDFDHVVFNNCPDGYKIFKKITPKTVAKAYLVEALRLI